MFDDIVEADGAELLPPNVNTETTTVLPLVMLVTVITLGAFAPNAEFI